MISFQEMLNQDQAEAIHQYIISQANATYENATSIRRRTKIK